MPIRYAPVATTSGWAATTARSSSSATTATDGCPRSPSSRRSTIRRSPNPEVASLPEPIRPPRRRDRPRRGHADRQRLPDLLVEPRRRRHRDAADPELRRVGVRGPDRRRGPRLRPDRPRWTAKMARRMTRFIHFAMAAGKEAVADSRDRLRGDDARTSATGSASSSTPAAAGSRRSSTGPTSTTRRARASSARSRSRRCRARWARRMLSMEYGLTGPVMTQVAACATSVIAFHDALRLIRTGECDVVLTGGSEAPVVPDGRRRARQHGRPVEAQRLARDARRGRSIATRDGFVLGEGGGVVVVESLAARAGARRDADRRGHRRRADGRRVPHQRARSRPAAARRGR